MMKTFSLRIKESEYDKIKTIAERQSRSANKQIEQIIYQFIQDYEKVNGKIEVEQ